MLGLRTTIYKVGDMEKASLWYGNAFDEKPYFEESYYVGFNVCGYELGLQPEENPTTDKQESVINYWGVEDIQKEHDYFLANGAILVCDIVDVGGDILMSTYKDPWGNMLGLIYNPNFGNEIKLV